MTKENSIHVSSDTYCHEVPTTAGTSYLFVSNVYNFRVHVGLNRDGVWLVKLADIYTAVDASRTASTLSMAYDEKYYFDVPGPGIRATQCFTFEKALQVVNTLLTKNHFAVFSKWFGEVVVPHCHDVLFNNIVEAEGDKGWLDNKTSQRFTKAHIAKKLMEQREETPTPVDESSPKVAVSDETPDTEMPVHTEELSSKKLELVQKIVELSTVQAELIKELINLVK